MRCRSSAYLIAKRGLKRETIGGMNMSAPIKWKPSSSTSRSAMSAWNFMGKNTQKMMLAVSETPVKSTVFPVVSNMRRMATSKPSPAHSSSTMREHVVAVVDPDADADRGHRQRDRQRLL